MKNILALVIFVCSFTFVYAQQPDTTKKMDPEAAKHYNSAMKSMKADKFDDAVAALDSAIQISPDYNFFLMKGLASYKLKNYKESEKSYRECLKQNQKSDAVYQQLARVFLDQKMWNEAIEAFKNQAKYSSDANQKAGAEAQILTIQKDMAIELYNKGIELTKKGSYDEALATYQKSLDLQQDYKTYYQMGVAYQKSGKSAEAIKAFDQALTLNKDFAQAHIAMANVHYTEKQYPEAISDYEKAIESGKDEKIKAAAKEGAAKAYFQTAAALFAKKDYDKARENFVKSNSFSESEQNLLFIGRCFGDRSKPLVDSALAYFDKAVSMKKSVTEGQVGYYKGSMYMNKGDMGKALEQFSISQKDDKFKKFSDSQIAFIKAKLEQDKEKAGKKK